MTARGASAVVSWSLGGNYTLARTQFGHFNLEGQLYHGLGFGLWEGELALMI